MILLVSNCTLSLHCTPTLCYQSLCIPVPSGGASRALHLVSTDFIVMACVNCWLNLASLFQVSPVYDIQKVLGMPKSALTYSIKHTLPLSYTGHLSLQPLFTHRVIRLLRHPPMNPLLRQCC